MADDDEDALQYHMAYCTTCKCTHAFGVDGWSGAPLEMPGCREESEAANE